MRLVGKVKSIFPALIAGLVFVLALPSALALPAFEQSSQCLSTGVVPPALGSFNPAASVVNINQDAKSRYVVYAMAWRSASGGVGILATGFGVEFKTHQFNYDSAAATGKGPALCRFVWNLTSHAMRCDAC